MRLFDEFKINSLTLKNRIVMPPMCTYQAGEDGFPNEFHYCHYGVRSQGGAGLIIVEATGITPEGRISDQDLGIWSPDHVACLRKLTDICHNNGAKIAIQLNHAGRKSESIVRVPLAPSSIAFSDEYRMPEELSRVQIEDLISSFSAAAVKADASGFDAVEIHGAHGYLIHQFLSPLTNRRTDEYGGSIENRTRFLKEVLTAVRAVLPPEKPLWVRISASDYAKGGIDPEMMVEIINMIRPLIDMVHVSSGGLLPISVSSFPGYQVPFAKKIRRDCHVPTIAVGLITEENLAEEILGNGRADLVAMGRQLLRDPYWPIRTAVENNIPGYVPKPYERAFK